MTLARDVAFRMPWAKADEVLNGGVLDGVGELEALAGEELVVIEYDEESLCLGNPRPSPTPRPTERRATQTITAIRIEANLDSSSLFGDVGKESAG